MADDKWIKLDPSPSDFDIVEIAHALALQCCFHGHTKHFYSVAYHSVLVSRLLHERRLDSGAVFCGLMYDAAKAYVGNEAQIEAAIAKRYGLPYPFPNVVKRADNVLLTIERRDLLGLPPPMESDIKLPAWDVGPELGWRGAKALFLERFRELYVEKPYEDEIEPDVDVFPDQEAEASGLFGLVPTVGEPDEEPEEEPELDEQPEAEDVENIDDGLDLTSGLATDDEWETEEVPDEPPAAQEVEATEDDALFDEPLEDDADLTFGLVPTAELDEAEVEETHDDVGDLQTSDEDEVVEAPGEVVEAEEARS